MLAVLVSMVAGLCRCRGVAFGSSSRGVIGTAAVLLVLPSSSFEAGGGCCTPKEET
jgi:hypothetical protein